MFRQIFGWSLLENGQSGYKAKRQDKFLKIALDVTNFWIF